MKEEIPVSVELMATQDRKAVTILVRSRVPILMKDMITHLRVFADQLHERFEKPQIETIKSKIIVP